MSKQARGLTGGRGSITLIVFGPDRSLDRDAQRPDLGPQAAAGNAKEAGCLNLVASGVLQDADQDFPLHQRQALVVQLFRASRDPFGDEAVPIEPSDRSRSG